MKGVHGAHPACVPMRPLVPWKGAPLLAEPSGTPQAEPASSAHRASELLVAQVWRAP